MNGNDARTAALWVGIVFCVALLAMTASVVVDLEIQEWTFAVILLVFFIVFGVAILGMLLTALVSALRNPPDE